MLRALSPEEGELIDISSIIRRIIRCVHAVRVFAVIGKVAGIPVSFDTVTLPGAVLALIGGGG